MKKGIFQLCFSVFILMPFVSQAAQLQGIGFQQRGDTSSLEFMFDTKDVKAERFHIGEDRQIVVDFESVRADAKTLRAFDTSEFSGPVVFVSAYSKSDNPDNLRVVIQLRDNVKSVLQKNDNKVTLRIENRFGVFNQELKNASTGEQTKDGLAALIHVPKSDSLEDILENLTLSGPKRYVGEKISLNVKDVPFENIMRMIAEVSGFSIVLTEAAKQAPPVSLSFVNIPWDQVLDMLLDLNRLVAERNGSILVIESYQVRSERKKNELEEQKSLVEAEPMETRIIPISYAQTANMGAVIKPYLTPEKGTSTVDTRTNSLIIKDTTEIIERVAKIVEALDTQTPQILIESKIVEVNESHRKTIGFDQGIGFDYNPPAGRARPMAGFSFSSAFGVGGGGSQDGGGDEGGDEGGGEGQSGGGRSSLGTIPFTIGRISSLLDLSFQLRLLEEESKGKIIASPRVVTQNNQAATITSSDQRSYEVRTETDEGITTTYAPIAATLSMQVTPTVTNEGSINMKVNISKAQFTTQPSTGPPNQATRSVQTDILVDSGSTVVIGGLYSYSSLERRSGIPFLKDIPLLGWLFSTPYSPQEEKAEMMIFLTPRIINQAEAGLIDRV